MALEVNIVPNIRDSGNGVPTTELEITIDVSSILAMLSKYDLLIKTKLRVKVINPISNIEEVNIYEYSQIYRNIQNAFIIFKTIVVGQITNTSSIIGTAEGVYLNKKVDGVG